MTTQYTPILQLALPVTGELNGTWGDVVNDNITSMVEEAIAGLATISTWTANSHTLTTADGVTDEARCAMLVLQTGAGGTALSGAGQVICPALTKLYVVKNDAAYAVTVKTSGGSGVAIAAGDTAFVFCDGTNVNACVTQIINGHITGNLTVDGNTTLGDSSADTVVINAGSTTINDGGAIRFEDNAGGEYVAIKAPATVTATYTLTLPIDDGTNGQALITDGSGNLSWSTAASGDVYGPASATDNAVARFDGTTGKLIQNSAVTIDDDGATVIAANSTSDGLRITQIGAGNALVVEDSANPDSSPFVINTFGQVLVGTTTGISSEAVQVTGTNYGTSALKLLRFSADAGSSSVVYGKSRGATIGDYSIVSVNDALGNIEFQGADGAALIRGASITAAVDGTPGTNDMPGRLVFSTTADGGITPTERMRIGSHGGVGLGVSGSSNVDLYIGRALTGATAYGVLLEANAGSDVTATGRGFSTVIGTAASAFTLPDIQHYRATQGTFGAGSAITSQYGYFAHGNLTGATNNYGFYSNIASGTGRWNFYAGGTAQNYFAGATFIGTDTTSSVGGKTSANLNLSTIGGTAANILATQWSASGAASAYIGLSRSVSGTNGVHSLVGSGGLTGTIEFAGSDGTQFIPTANIYSQVDGTSGTNDMPGRLVFSTTADGASSPTERMRIGSTGVLAIGSTTTVGGGSGCSIRFANDLTGSTTPASIVGTPQVKSDATTAATVYTTAPTTQATSFTCGLLTHYQAAQGVFGAGSTVTSQYGFSAAGSLTGATNNYGFYSAIASGTGRYNFYAAGTAANYFAGITGIGSTPFSGCNLRLNINAVSSNEAASVYIDGTIPSTATSQAIGIYSVPNVEASAFTLPNLRHFYAVQGTIGAGATVTNQYGFSAYSNLTGATNNYGFHSTIASGTGRWNFYAAGTADNYFAGTLLLGYATANVIDGSTPRLQVNGPSTSASSMAAVCWSSDGNSRANLKFAKSNSGTVGVHTAVASGSDLGQVSFSGSDGTNFVSAAAINCEADDTVATNSVPGRITFSTTALGGTSVTERMRIDNAGRVGIGVVASSGYNFRVGSAMTGSLYPNAIIYDGTINSDATGEAFIFRSQPSTQAAAFTTSICHFHSQQGTKGSGSTITNQIGFRADSTLTGATNNYGFKSDIAAGTGRWNFYAAGTADNYFAGNIGIGSTSLTNTNLRVGKNVTGGVNSYGILSEGIAQSDVTNAAASFSTNASTAASAFTLSSLRHYQAIQGTIGAGSTVTNQYCFFTDATPTGATNNYGFYSGIASGTGRWNFYAAGSANNYFGGNTGIGTAPNWALTVYDANNGFAQFVTSGTGAASTDGLLVGINTSQQAVFRNRENTDALFYTNDTERMRIDSSGKVLIGATSSAGGYSGYNFLIGGSASPMIKMQSTVGPTIWDLYVNGSTDFRFAVGSSDKAKIDASTGAYTALSDANKKKDFEDSTAGLAEVLKLKPTLYRMIDQDESVNKQLGFIAQDVKDVIPQAYVESEGINGAFIGLQDRPFIAVLVKAIQELKAELDATKAEVAALKAVQ